MKGITWYLPWRLTRRNMRKDFKQKLKSSLPYFTELYKTFWLYCKIFFLISLFLSEVQVTAVDRYFYFSWFIHKWKKDENIPKIFQAHVLLKFLKGEIFFKANFSLTDLGLFKEIHTEFNTLGLSNMERSFCSMD